MWLLAVTVHAALAVIAARGFGTIFGIVLYSLSVLALVAVAGLALKNSTVGNITWRNWLAGCLLPWIKWVGGGQLTSLLIKNAMVSILFGWLMIWCDRSGFLHELVGLDANGDSRNLSWLAIAVLWITLGGWLILSTAWIWLIRSCAQNRQNDLSILFSERGNWLSLLLPPLSVGVSIALRYANFPALALAVVAIPLLIIAGPVLLMMSVILWHQLRGKPIRWN